MPIFYVPNALEAMRGVISDRHGVPLAISTPIMKIVIDPRDYWETKSSMMMTLRQNYKRPNQP